MFRGQNYNFFNEASAYVDIKHTLRSYEALTCVRMKQSADYSSPCGEATLHNRRLLHFSCTVKCASLKKALAIHKCFFLAPPAGLVQTKRLSIVLSNDGAQSANNTRRVYRAGVLRHATASGAKRKQRHQLLTVMLTPENIVVYLSSMLRIHSSSYTPYFRNLPSKNDTQSFFSVVCQLRIAHFCEHIVVNYNIVD